MDHSYLQRCVSAIRVLPCHDLVTNIDILLRSAILSYRLIGGQHKEQLHDGQSQSD